MAGPGDGNAHNNFRSVGVGLYAQLGPAARAEAIARELAGHRRRGAHPAMRASAAAFAAVPPVCCVGGSGNSIPASARRWSAATRWCPA
jgi:hypothetical protein